MALIDYAAVMQVVCARLDLLRTQAGGEPTLHVTLPSDAPPTDGDAGQGADVAARRVRLIAIDLMEGRSQRGASEPETVMAQVTVGCTVSRALSRGSAYALDTVLSLVRNHLLDESSSATLIEAAGQHRVEFLGASVVRDPAPDESFDVQSGVVIAQARVTRTAQSSTAVYPVP
jgi:hypothetical protein